MPSFVINFSNQNTDNFTNTYSDTNATNFVKTSNSISFQDPGGINEIFAGTNFVYNNGDLTNFLVTSYTVTNAQGNTLLGVTGLNITPTVFQSLVKNIKALSANAADGYYLNGGGDTLNTYGTSNIVYLGSKSNTVIGTANGPTTAVFHDPKSDYTILGAATPGSYSVTETSGPGTDGTTIVTNVTNLQFADQTLTPAAALTPPTETASLAIANAQAGNLTSVISIMDSAADITANLNALENIAVAGKISAITLSDGGIPSLSITSAQASSDAKLLSEISGNFSVIQSAGSSSQTIAGVTNALGNTVSFSGNASQYTVTPAGDGVHFTVTRSGISDQVSSVQALQFSDHTEIVAAAPAANNVTTGNITELYGAVFGREPDVAGLAYYLNYSKSAPSTPLIQYAEYFLASAEYKNNTQHNYAQTAAGDQQFITDSYQNLLGRTPSATETAFYENNVIAPMLAGLTAGSAAYAAAQAVAHAQTLVYFSASAEFLGDVQINSANPASSSHWLLLI